MEQAKEALPQVTLMKEKGAGKEKPLGGRRNGRLIDERCGVEPEGAVS